MSSKMVKVLVSLLVAFAAMVGAATEIQGNGAQVVLENAQARLILGTNGIAQSFIMKATGEELLVQPPKTPFATLTHARPYAKVAQLTYPAHARDFAANRIVQKGNLLEIGFGGTRDTITVETAVFSNRLEFAFKGFGITESKMDPKWVWRPEAVRFVQLAFAKRTHFGEWMNVVWDEAQAAALMGLNAETRLAADTREGEAHTLYAAGEIGVGYTGLAAALIATPTSQFLDAVDAFECAHNLPRGVAARRSPWAKASYLWADGVTPDNVDRYIAMAKRGGFPLLMLSYTSFAKTCGHYLWRESYPKGLNDLKAVCGKIRASGLKPGLHIHYSKVSRDDPYVTAAKPDTRFNIVSTFTLAHDISASETEIPIETHPVNWNSEDGRRLVQIGREWVAFAGVSEVAPWRLMGCTRGFLGSKATAHTEKDVIRHVDVDNWVRFIRLNAASAIADEIADRIGTIYSTCGFEFAYFDGAEDVPQPYWYHVSHAQERVWRKLEPAPIAAETYVRNHFGWHMFARGNAFDPYKPGQMIAAYRRYQEPCMREARENFTTVDLGWTNLKGKTAREFEFLLARAREWQAPVALWVHLKDVEANPESEEILELFRQFNTRRGDL